MTDQLWAVLAIVLVVLIAGAAVLTSSVRRRRTRGYSRQRPAATTLLEEEPEAQEAQAPPPDEPDAADSEESAAPAADTITLDRPEPVAGRMVRLRERLARSGTLGQTLLAVLSRGSLGEEDWEEIEETLLLADVGLDPTTELLERLRTRVQVLGTTDPAQVRDVLRAELLDLLDPSLDRSLATTPGIGDDGESHPATVLVVGVNGTGKTTTVGKLARVLVAEGRSVVLGAADTFRAAAADQLQTWGDRVGVATVRSERDGADPAAVAFDAVKTGREQGSDVVLVDTAGRLHSKAGLMDELGKIKRVVARHAPVSEVLLVLDATTGQNGMRQAQVFAEVVDISGIVLTKLDGTAKGGIVVAVQRELGVPVKLVGLGEGPDDLAPFDPETFVDTLLA
ncbi:MAG TPA: signal recognition particle-docking protein FtsY [Actinomycetaceae bacterium]|nr:signal recognition particle-docking protein FtsY [Actinomycetaceae bacterium]